MSASPVAVTQAAFILIILLSLAGRLGAAGKYLELASHFKVQYIIAAVLCGVIFTVAQSWLWAAAALTLIVAEGMALLPNYRAPQPSATRGERRKLRLLLSNVQYGNRKFSALMKLAREEQPDVLIVQEVTEEWCDELRALTDLYPHRIAVPRARGAGIALLSRIPFDQSEVVFLADNQRPGIELRINVGGRQVSFLTMHTHAPIRRFHFGYRNALLNAAAPVARRLPAPVVLIGDLNISPWSPHFAALLRATNLREARRGFGLLPTWPTWLRLPFLMLPIDHCLVSPGIDVIEMRTGRNIGSDHLPIIIDLAFPDLPAIRT